MVELDKNSSPIKENSTKLIHLGSKGNYQLDCTATVLSCEVVGDKNVENEGTTATTTLISLELDMTTMYPQGGGQPTDYGTIKTMDDSEEKVAAIEKVMLDRSRNNTVTHVGRMISGMEPFPVGCQVHVSVDAERRQILSECQTAGHVVDAAMSRCGKAMKPTKGYHFLEGPYVEYKGSIPPAEREAFLIDLKSAYQDLLDEDIPTKIETMTVQDAEQLCNRVQQNFDFSLYGTEKVRIVTVADWPCPCGGTHVKSTGELKQRGWGPIGIKSKKGVVRIRYGCNDTSKS